MVQVAPGGRRARGGPGPRRSPARRPRAGPGGRVGASSSSDRGDAPPPAEFYDLAGAPGARGGGGAAGRGRGSASGPGRRSLLALGGGAVLGTGFLVQFSKASWRMTYGNPFRLVKDADTGEVYLRTPEGHYAKVFRDERGYQFYVDSGGNMYFDSMDPEMGFTRVAPDGSAYTYTFGAGGDRWEEHYAGNIDRDLVELQTEEFGRVVGWRDRTDETMQPLCADDGGNTILCVDGQGNPLEGREQVFPKQLNEGELDVTPRRRLLGGFKKHELSEDDIDINTFTRERPPTVDLGLDP